MSDQETPMTPMWMQRAVKRLLATWPRGLTVVTASPSTLVLDIRNGNRPGLGIFVMRSITTSGWTDPRMKWSDVRAKMSIDDAAGFAADLTMAVCVARVLKEEMESKP